MADDHDELQRKLGDMDHKLNRISQQMDQMTAHDGNAKLRHKEGYLAEEIEEDSEDEFTTDFTKDENEDRGNWSGRLDFLLACLGYAVGLGNVWRFPYLCYKNGGAVFFIPYVIMLTFVGIPIFFLELSLGQFTSQGPLTCWECAPFFKGIGVAMCIVSGLVGIYYNMIIAWSIYYLFASFTSELPWATCKDYFASEWCNLKVDVDFSCIGANMNESSGVCWNTTNDDYHPIAIYNRSMARANGYRSRFPAEEYYGRYAVGKDLVSGIEELGPLRWDLSLCYLCAWVIVGASLIQGVKSSGKVVYFTALFPYVVLVILLVRGLTLNGYFKGIEFYLLTPDLSKLSDSAVWKDAAVQIFFSLSDSWGGLIALASYNRFHNDCLRDTLIVAIGNCLTSFFAGFVIFSFLGFLAWNTGQEVDEVVESGVGLAFIVYPDAVTRMPVSVLWAILFFIMLITLGLDSEFALVETVTTAILDQFPSTRKRKWLVIVVTCIIGFFLGLTMCTNGGAYMLQLMDHYAGGWNVLVIALCECICIAYVYGYFRYREDVRIMLGNYPCCCLMWNCCSWYWAVMWYFFTPVGVLFILIYSWVDYKEATYDDYVYPPWAAALGWLMTIVVVLGIVVTGIGMVIYYAVKGIPMKQLFLPSKYWGPSLKKHRKLMLNYLDPSQIVLDPYGEDEAAGADVEMNIHKTDYANDNLAYTSSEKF